MASVESVGARGVDRRYRVRWRTPEGAQRKQTFRLREDADRFAREVEVAKDRSAYVDPAAGRVTFEAYAERWRCAQLHWDGATAERVEWWLVRYAYPVLGRHYLTSLERSIIQGWVAGMAERLAPRSVAVVLGYVATICSAAVDDGLLPKTPCRGIRLPKAEASPIIPITAEQVGSLLAHAPPRWAAPILLGAGAGLRQAEMAAVTVDRIDWLRRTLHVDRQLACRGGRVFMKSRPKTPSSRRVIPLPSSVLSGLSRHVGQFPPIEISDEGGEVVKGVLFSTHISTPLQRGTVSQAVKRIVSTAGLPGGTTYHDLRHFYASLLIAKGASVKVVQRLLGHARATTTLDVYAHLWPDDDEAAAMAVDAVLTAIVSPVPETCHEQESVGD